MFVSHIVMENNGKNNLMYDLTQINRLCADDTALIREILNLFIEEVPKDVREMRLSFYEEEIEGVRKMAHKLKQNVYTFGIVTLQEPISEMATKRIFEMDSKKMDEYITLVEKILLTIIADFQKLLAR
jgi:HPt (histidine-containing phosphotransfer) domain-containing protein